jgi:hypothetical protein
VPTVPNVPVGPTTTGVAERGNRVPPLPPMPGLVPAGASTRSAQTSPPGARVGVAVYGDSLVLHTWEYLHRIAADRGQPFAGGAYGGTALCDWLPAIRSSLRDDKPAYLVLSFAGNNITRCTLGVGRQRQTGAPLIALYRTDAQRAIIAARAAGTKVFLVGPPAMKEGVWNEDAIRLRRAMHDLADHNPGVVFLDAGRVLSPHGFTRKEACRSFETKPLGCRNGLIVVRAADGVHLAHPIGGEGGYSGGAWRFANVLMRGIPNAS